MGRLIRAEHQAEFEFAESLPLEPGPCHILTVEIIIWHVSSFVHVNDILN